MALQHTIHLWPERHSIHLTDKCPCVFQSSEGWVGNRDGNIDLPANSLRKSCFIYLNMVDISPVSHLHYTVISSLFLTTMSRSSAAGLVLH